MSASFGPQRSFLPPNTLGQQFVAQRRVSQAVARAAEKTSIAVSVDAHPSRVWLRNLRGTIPCLCSSSALGTVNQSASNGSTYLHIEPGVGDDLGGPDSGYPYPQLAPLPTTELPGEAPNSGSPFLEINPLPNELLVDLNERNSIDDLGKLLLGNGRRCGICWGTGWVDGHKLWGGIRFVCCAINTLGVVVNEGSNADVDVNPPTPTLVGPENPNDTSTWVSWTLEIPVGFTNAVALRVRNGLQPASGNWQLFATTATSSAWVDAATALGLNYGLPGVVCLQSMPTQFKLVLGAGAQVSHVEFIVSSEPLLNLQLPQLQMTASAEMIGPILTEEFELDPIVGYVERRSVIEIPGRGGRVGSVWEVSDVTVKRDAQGVVFGVVGNCRNVQPTEVLACVSMEDALTIGIPDPGLASRGMENTGSGEPSGVGGQVDDSLAATKRGSQQRLGGGASQPNRATIVLSQGIDDV